MAAGAFLLSLALTAAWLDSALGQLPKAAPKARTAAPLPNIPTRNRRSLDDIKKLIANVEQRDAQFQIIVGQGRLLTLKQDLAQPNKPRPTIAIGDPTVISVNVIGPRHLRVTGRRIGVTDLSLVTGDGESYSMEVSVIADLAVLQAKLRQSFPDAQLELAQIREHVIVGGQARDSRQVTQILQLIRGYLDSIQTSNTVSGQQGAGGPQAPPQGKDLQPPSPQKKPAGDEQPPTPAEVGPQTGMPNISATTTAAQIINLIRVPGPQQVLLKVQIAELNRTALRRLGVSMLFQDANTAVGSNIGAGLVTQGAGAGAGGGTARALLGLLNPLLGPTTTAFGVFDGAKVNFFFDALRQNQVLKILAEPNLVAMNGQTANFLAGGQFPVPVPQPSGGGPSVVTIQFKSFGVSLGFVPFIIDGERIRLSVEPEVSSIDFSTGVVIQGTAVPGINTRRTSTVVEMREGQTLAISGILQVQLDGSTARIPGLGDLPYIGSMFRNNSTQNTEKELIVMVTPYLIEPMNADQVPAKPGDDVAEPTDIEFYLLGRIERRACREDFRAVTAWDDPLDVEHRRKIEERYVVGPYGYSP